MSRENHLKDVIEYIKSINLEATSRDNLVLVMEHLPHLIQTSAFLIDNQFWWLEQELSEYRAENKKSDISTSPKKQIMTVEQLETIAFDPKTPEKEAKKVLGQLMKIVKKQQRGSL